MAKATTRKKTKTSARKGGAAKRKRSAKKSTSSRSRNAAGKSKKTKTKAAKRTKKKTAARKTARQAATKQAARKKASKKTGARKKTARKVAKKKTTRKKTASRTAARKATTKAKKKAAPKGSRPAPVSKKAAAKATEAKHVPSRSAEEAAKAAEAEAKTVLPTVEEAMAQLPYHEGQFVVHPKYGLGKVDRITERKLSTRTVPCLEISFSYQEMRLTIPVDQVGRSGLRRPISRRQIDEVFKALKGRATFDAKRRSAKRVVDYRKRLNQGDPISLAEAIRDLGRLSLKKSLSYEERKILSTALRILSREVALARGREPDDVREEIEKIVYR